MTPDIARLRARVCADDALRILPTLTDAPLHLVGGVVRDALCGVNNTHADWDIVVPAGAFALAQRFAAAIGGSYVPLHEAHPTARVVFRDTQYDFAEYREPTLNDDLRARDLTINAIAADLHALLAGVDVPLVDPCGGVDDLVSGILRPCGPDIFAADPVRIVRLYRFVAMLGFVATPEAERQVRAVQAVRTHDGGAWWWATVAPERVTDELARLFTASHAATGITGLVRAGVLDAFVPYIAATRSLIQGPNHHLDVFDHNLAASVAVVGEFLVTRDAWAVPYADDLQQWLDAPTGGTRTRQWLVPFAALLHDVGKAITQATKPNGKPEFPRHEAAGGHIAAQVATNLHLSRAERKALVAFVRYHGYPNALQRHGADHALRFFAVVGDTAPGVILVAMGDRATARGGARTSAKKVMRDIVFLQGLMREYFGVYAPLFAIPPLVRGDALIEALALLPGRRIGELLLLLRRRQLDGTLSETSDALDAARSLMASRHPAHRLFLNGQR